MLRDANIVCFGKDWTDHPTSNNHVMNELALHNRVLWLNSIGSRAPTFTSGRDLRKILRKLASLADGPKQVKDNMWVYTPILLPFPHSQLAVRVNREILKRSLALVRRRLGMKDFQLWSFYPTPVEYVGKLGESLSVYYVVDAWDHLPGMSRDQMRRLDEEFARKADVVFATARSLVDLKRPLNPETHLASHGVDHAHFSKALDPSTVVPPDLAQLGKPIIGFFGLLQEWVDQDLFCLLAQRHPEWAIVIIGNTNCDVSKLRAVPNIHLLGGRDYSTLPQYCRGFAVGIIPFKVNELTYHVNPIKLREYLSAGLPVVSTPMPEVKAYGHLCSVPETADAFVAAVERELAQDTPMLHQMRSAAMASERWEEVVGRVGDHVVRVSAKRHGH
jgi:glycosyltransferase involved in cell wall biosynthesis